MKKFVVVFYFLVFTGVWCFPQCTEAPGDRKIERAGLDPLLTQTGSKQNTPKQSTSKQEQIKLGEHLVLIAGCHGCHTPKKMTENGPEPDFSLALSGHPAELPPPDVDRKEVEKKGLGITQTLTAWVGPWGISYAANLTSDRTGIGNWKEENFMIAIREGKFKGIKSARTLLPPMPWQMMGHMTDEELKAIFAYLKSTKPISNVVPPPQLPLSAVAGKK